MATFLRESDPRAASETIRLILDGVKILSAHPLIGRPVDVNRRELIIYRGRTGYLVQYAFRLAKDEVVILSIHHQREVGG